MDIVGNESNFASDEFFLKKKVVVQILIIQPCLEFIVCIVLVQLFLSPS